MKTIRIHIRNNDTEEAAILRVLAVVRRGKISRTNKYGEQYCMASVFGDGTPVYCKKYDKGTTFDVCMPQTTLVSA